MWDYGFDGVIATISAAKGRYAKRIDISEEELEQMVYAGRTQQEIADHYQCSVDTIQRRMKQYGIVRPQAAKNTAKPQEPHRSAELPQKNRKQFNANENGNEKEKNNGNANTGTPHVSF